MHKWIFIWLSLIFWQTMASKNIIADLNKGDKLNGDNYDTWRHKIWYVPEEQDWLEGINHMMEDLGVGQTAQQRRDQETYQTLKKKNFTARAILVSFCWMISYMSVNSSKLLMTSGHIWERNRVVLVWLDWGSWLLNLILTRNFLIRISHNMWGSCLLWLENWNQLIIYSLMSNKFRLSSALFLIIENIWKSIWLIMIVSKHLLMLPAMWN